MIRHVAALWRRAPIGRSGRVQDCSSTCQRASIWRRSWCHTPRMRRHRRKATVAALAVALAMTSACSGGSHRATQHPPPTTTASPSTSPSSTLPSSTQPTTTITASSTVTAPSTVPSQSPTPTVTIGRWTGREPFTIYFSGDAGNIATDLKWSAWTADRALASGTWHYLSCQPSCAAGTSTPYPVTISLTDAIAGRFTKLVEKTSGPHAFTQTLTAPYLGQGACANANSNSCGFSS